MKKLKKILSVAVCTGILLSFSELTAISVTDGNEVYLGGDAFGIKFYSKGVVIIDTESYYDGSKYICPAKEAGLKTNDIILEADGKVIKTNEELQFKINSSGNEKIELTVERNGKKFEKCVKPKKNTAGMYLIGAWVRDSCAGIGTVTYYDSQEKYFAALGHGICDSDTSNLMPLGHGEAASANINGIIKSKIGKAGSLNGYFTNQTIGNLVKNTQTGVYGTINDNLLNNKKKIEVAENDEIKTGKAQLYTTIYGDSPKCYSIEITKINNLNKNSNENFVIKITDGELINTCGGIVQGMSGSPITQNGKLVGAVTHVFLNSPTEGYAITAQNMVTNYGE